MNTSLKALGVVSTAVCAFASSVLATSYNGNKATGFGGPFGNGMLTFTSSSGTVSGTITPGNNVSATTGQIYDEAVIYIDSVAGGFANTSTFTAATLANGNADYLQQAVAGSNGTLRATVNFATGFGADYAIGISPSNAAFGALYSITATGGLNFLQSVNLAPTGGVGPYTFSFSLANIGSPTSFRFSTTYLNAHNDLFRSNETIGNTITDVTTPSNTGNLGQDTASVGFVTFAVPEPGTWAMMLGGVGVLALSLRRRSLR